MKKINHISLLRGLATLMIIGWHIRDPFIYFHIDNIDLSWLFSWSEEVGVWIFFIISGYLIGKGFYSGKYQLSSYKLFYFYLKRLLKITPLYYLTIVYLYIIYGNALNFPTKHIPLYLLFLANNYIRDPYMGYLWFISVIMQLYFISPVIYLVIMALRRHVPIGFQSIFLLSYSLLTLFLVSMNGIPDSWGMYNTRYFPSLLLNSNFFIFGFFINELENKKNYLQKLSEKTFSRLSKYLNLFIWSSLIILFLYSSYINYSSLSSIVNMLNFAQFILPVLFILPIFTCLVVGAYIYISNWQDQKNFNQKGLSFLSIPVYLLCLIGNLSFGMYLLQYPVIFALNIKCNPYCKVQQFIPYLFLVVSISIVVATIFDAISRFAFSSPLRILSRIEKQ